MSGVPVKRRGPYKRRPLADRFWEKVALAGPDDCWIWKASKIRGYGVMGSGGKRGTVLAHRLSYSLHFGDFDQSLHVCHRCDNPPCVNPAHLFLGTRSENMQDAIQKGRFVDPMNGVANRDKTHCIRGHEFTAENTYRWKGVGYRQCRICKHDAVRRARASRSG